jgi:hypothetical protein
LGDFEIISQHQDGDEDVIHIRKRAPSDNTKNECGSDCLNYSGWTKNGKMEDGDADETLPSEEAFETRSLMRRDGRKKTMNAICAGVALSTDPAEPVIPADGIRIWSPTWPGLDYLEKVSELFSVHLLHSLFPCLHSY